jgi:hypothetical protein
MPSDRKQHSLYKPDHNEAGVYDYPAPALKSRVHPRLVIQFYSLNLFSKNQFCYYISYKFLVVANKTHLPKAKPAVCGGIVF